MNTELLDVLTLIPLEKMTRSHHGESRESVLPVDILESSTDYTFFLDVPGLSKSDLQVTVEEERILLIKSGGGGGKRKRDQESEEDGCKYLRLERRRLPIKMNRKFRLPEDADVANVSAKCENGVLTVSVKKVPPPPMKKAKNVQIAVS